MAKLKIGDKEFDIDKFNINDIMTIDEKVGDITKLGQEEKIRDKFKNVRYVLWYALQKKDKKITEEEVGEMVTISELEKTLGQFLKVVDLAGNPTVTPKVSKK